MQARMLWYDITFSLDKAVSPSLQGSTALALFSAGKIHSADRPATANPYCPKSCSGAIQLPLLKQVGFGKHGRKRVPRDEDGKPIIEDTISDTFSF
jgi:hypothetical protein